MTAKGLFGITRTAACSVKANRFVLATAAALIIGLHSGIAAADLSSTANFNIVPQQLPSALLKYSEQSGVQVTSASDLVDGKSSAGAVGSLSARRALEQILQGTNLRYDVVNDNTGVIVVQAASPSPSEIAAIKAVLERTALIDGHNDLLSALVTQYPRNFLTVDLAGDARKLASPLHTDLPRLTSGGVGGQFWSVWVSPTLPGPQAVLAALEQIDLMRQLVARYPDRLAMASSAADIRRIHRGGRIAALLGIEGGGAIANSLAVLRLYHALGARYLTLTHHLNSDWADSATAPARHHGLTSFGNAAIAEMNRLGMLVDLSHTSIETMRAALVRSAAPVIFSHSSARALVDHPRNVPDDVLRLVRVNRGIVMVNFYPGFVSEEYRLWSEQGAHGSKPVVTLQHVADHIEHIRDIAGVDHVGVGADFDGVKDLPVDLPGVEAYPALLHELRRRGWTDADLAKLIGENVLRVLEEAEAVACRLADTSGETAGEGSRFGCSSASELG